MLDLYVLLTFKGIHQRRNPPAQERGSQGRGSQKLPGVLDPYVLLTFKGTQQKGALPAQERGSQLGVLDPYVLLTFKGPQQRGALSAQGRRSQKLPGVLDPYVLLTFKGTQQRGAPRPCQPRREAPRSCWGCWILTSSLLLKELAERSPASPGQGLTEGAGGAGSLRPPYF